MITDAAELPPNATIDADVCVVGSGLAGLALAREFLGRGARVAVLEAGGARPTRRSQALYSGEQGDVPDHPLTHSRFRAYGGSGTRWTGQCVPLEPIDFERRESMPLSGWPFGRDALEDAYRRAGELFGLGERAFDVETTRRHGGPGEAIAGGELEESVIRFARPHDLGAMLKDDLAASGNVRVYLNAALEQLETDEPVRRVTAARALTPKGSRLRCRARSYVLACGGVENARLLLASDERASAGLGNEHDLVGRHYMDHPYLTTGYWRPAAGVRGEGLHVIDGFERVARSRGAHAVYTLAERVRRREGLNACVGYFIRLPAHEIEAARFSPGGQLPVQLEEMLRGRRFADRDHLARLLRCPSGTRGLYARAAAGTLARRVRALVLPDHRLALRMVVETTPCPESRVTLARTRDANGVRRARVDWRVESGDWRGVERFRTTLAANLERRGLGALVDDRRTDAAGWPLSMSGGKHPTGTTRMDADPRRGVVDEHCRVHSLSNLHVAGSSVFPTAGWANPTLTIVALAIRLADRLKRLS